MTLGCSGYFWRQTGAYDELRARIDSACQIVTIQHSARPDMSALNLGHFPDGIECAFGAQRHLKRGQPARDERLRDRPGQRQVRYDQHRNDRTTRHDRVEQSRVEHRRIPCRVL